MNPPSFEDILRVHVLHQIKNVARSILNDEEANSLIIDTSDWFSFTRNEPRPNSSTTRFDESDEAEEEQDRAVDEATKKDNHESDKKIKEKE